MPVPSARPWRRRDRRRRPSGLVGARIRRRDDALAVDRAEQRLVGGPAVREGPDRASCSASSRLMNLPVPDASSTVPAGALRVAEELPLVRVRQDPQLVAGGVALSARRRPRRSSSQLRGAAAEVDGAGHLLVGVLDRWSRRPPSCGRRRRWCRCPTLDPQRLSAGATSSCTSRPRPSGTRARRPGTGSGRAATGIGAAWAATAPAETASAADEQGCELRSHACVSVAIGAIRACKNTCSARGRSGLARAVYRHLPLGP